MVLSGHQHRRRSRGAELVPSGLIVFASPDQSQPYAVPSFAVSETKMMRLDSFCELNPVKLSCYPCKAKVCALRMKSLSKILNE